MIAVWVAFFVVIALIDIRYRIVPNLLVYPAVAVALALQLFVFQAEPLSVLLGGAFAFSIFALTAWIKPNSLGCCAVFPACSARCWLALG